MENLQDYSNYIIAAYVVSGFIIAALFLYVGVGYLKTKKNAK
jgi:hypothetical protein